MEYLCHFSYLQHFGLCMAQAASGDQPLSDQKPAAPPSPPTSRGAAPGAPASVSTGPPPPPPPPIIGGFNYHRSGSGPVSYAFDFPRGALRPVAGRRHNRHSGGPAGGDGGGGGGGRGCYTQSLSTALAGRRWQRWRQTRCTH